MAHTGSGTAARSEGRVGRRAMWQWTHSRGSAAANGSAPAKHPIQGDAQRVKIATGINRTVMKPVCSGAM